MEASNISSHKISSSTDIKHRIMKLNALKAEQEEQLKWHLHEFQYSIQPSTLIKNAVKGLKDKVDMKSDTVKETLNAGAGFLLDAIIFRNGMGVKKYLLNAGLKKVASFFIAKKSNTEVK
jgi:hypothetical protein